MANDTLGEAVPLLRRYLEAIHRLAEAEHDLDDPDESRRRWLVAHVAAARQGLFDYLLAHGWTPPEGEATGQQVLAAISLHEELEAQDR